MEDFLFSRCTKSVLINIKVYSERLNLIKKRVQVYHYTTPPPKKYSWLLLSRYKDNNKFGFMVI